MDVEEALKLDTTEGYRLLQAKDTLAAEVRRLREKAVTGDLLCGVLGQVAGDGGYSEGAVDCAKRIVAELERLRAEKEKPIPQDIHVRNCQCQAWPPAAVSDLRCVELRAAQPQPVDIVFDGPPGPESGRFVEVESPPGKSIKWGEWVKRSDGYWALRIPANVPSEAQPQPEKRKPEPRAVERLWERVAKPRTYPEWRRDTDLLVDQSKALDALVRTLRESGWHMPGYLEMEVGKAERAIECRGEGA